MNIDRGLWKEIQESFSKEFGVNILSFDRNNEEIVFSGEMPFYLELIKSKRPDLLSKENGCINIEKPLILYGEEIGKVVFGPLGFNENYDLKQLSARMGIEEEELRDASMDIKDVDKVSVEKMATIFANIIPKLTHQTQKQDKKIMELTALYKIIRKVNSTLDLDEVLKYIMNFLVNTLSAVDCSVFVFGEDGEKKYCLNDEVRKMIEIEKAVANKAIENKKAIIVKDIRAKFNIEVNDYYNSMLSLPLKLKDEVIGSVSIYGSSIGSLNEDNLEFISVVADQVAIAVVNARRFGEVKELAVVDKLTGVFNRRHFTEVLEKAFEEEITVENSLGLILLDIDNFGKYNNTHGHPKGDELLKEVAKILQESVRKEDIVGRYGGEEFIIMMKKVKPHEGLEVAQRIKEKVAAFEFYGRETQPGGAVTISAGLAITRAKVPMKELVKEADDALYKAKNSGKNRIVQKILLGQGLKAEI